VGALRVVEAQERVQGLLELPAIGEVAPTELNVPVLLEQRALEPLHEAVRPGMARLRSVGRAARDGGSPRSVNSITTQFRLGAQRAEGDHGDTRADEDQREAQRQRDDDATWQLTKNAAQCRKIARYRLATAFVLLSCLRLVAQSAPVRCATD
jgi:hypothetical protein